MSFSPKRFKVRDPTVWVAGDGSATVWVAGATGSLSHLSNWGSWIYAAEFGQQLPVWENKMEIWEVRIQFTGNPFVRLPCRISSLCSQTKEFFSNQSRTYQGDCIILPTSSSCKTKSLPQDKSPTGKSAWQYCHPLPQILAVELSLCHRSNPPT